MKNVSLFEDSKGYTVISDGENMVRLHQLVAIGSGADAAEVFSNGEYHCHHETGFKEDNRPEAVSSLKAGDHMKLHSDGEWTQVNGEPRLQEPA